MFDLYLRNWDHERGEHVESDLDGMTCDEVAAREGLLVACSTRSAFALITYCDAITIHRFNSKYLFCQLGSLSAKMTAGHGHDALLLSLLLQRVVDVIVPAYCESRYRLCS